MRTEEQRLKDNAKQRERRKRDGNKNNRSYEKTKNGYLMRMYSNMRNRVNGICGERHKHLYEGLEIMSREDFYALAKNDHDFHDLFLIYESSGYDMKLAPTPDRINSDLGYTPENIEFITHSLNSRRGNESRYGLI